MLLYPLAIVLIILTFCSSLFGHRRSVYASAMFLTFCVSIFDGYSTLVASIPGVAFSLFESIKGFYMDTLPLYDIGLGWMLPAAVGVIIGLLWPKNKKETAM